MGHSLRKEANVAVREARKGQRMDGGRGHQALIWVIVILVLVLGFFTLPFYVPVTLGLGDHTLVVRHWSPSKQWSRTPNWGVTTVTIAFPPPINIYGKESALFKFEGTINVHLVRIADRGFSWGW
jgi:hypothetical protein